MAVDTVPLPPALGTQAAHATASAPMWFTEYMSCFEARLENRIQAVITSQLADLSAKVDVQEEKLREESKKS